MIRRRRPAAWAIGLGALLLSCGSPERDGFVVWRARHAATRSEGGLPTSFLSAAVNMFAAGAQHADPDVRLSVADDAVRRIVVSLPDTRLVQ